MAQGEPVVSAEWLLANLADPNIKVLDGSWYMPFEKRNPFQEYQDACIPGALFFDIERISDLTSNLPHMLPSGEAFAAAVSALDVKNDSTIIVYDGKGVFSAPRVWWMFKIFGHEKVWVLDGGFTRWKALGYELQKVPSDAVSKSVAAIEAVQKVYQGILQGPFVFKFDFQPRLLWSLEQVKQNVDAQAYQLIDARPKGRFDGVDPEPRAGIRSGHIPGTKSIPFTEMIDHTQLLLNFDELRTRFDQKGISLDGPIAVSCASGVTACIVAMGLYRVGRSDVPVYDGSWIEWEAQPDTQIVTAAGC